MKQVLLLHGAIGSSEQLKPLTILLEHKLEVHSLNFSGHGGRAFESRFGIDQFAKDVIQYLDEKQITSIAIFGYSMGGYVALYLAKHYPTRIIEIITLGTKFKWNPEIALKETKMLNAEKIELKIPVFANNLSHRHSPLNWKEVLSKTALMMLEMGDSNPLKIEDFKSVTHQVKIGLADKDEMVSIQETNEVVNALPNSIFYSLVNSNHPIEKIDLEILSDEIKTFLGV